MTAQPRKPSDCASHGSPSGTERPTAPPLAAFPRHVPQEPPSVLYGASPGVALLVTVLILLVVALLGAAVVNMGRVDYALSGNYRAGIGSLHLADSGLQATAADLRADYDADPAASALAAWVDLSASPPVVASPFPDPAGMLVNGYVLSPANVSPSPYPGTPYDLGGTTAFGGGTYTRTIWLPPTISIQGGATTVNFQVRSTGAEGNPETPATTTIDGVVSIAVDDAGSYSSGIVLGDGYGGEVIEGGTVQIAGPVVVIGGTGGSPGRGRGRGRGRGAGGPGGLTTLSIGDLSQIANNYAGIDDAGALGVLASKLPALETQDLNGDVVSSLGTELHLKDAALSLASLGQLGAADVAGNAYKETLDGVFTDAAFDRTADNVYVDDAGAYDLDANLVFPGMSAPYTDPGSGTSYASFSDFLSANSYTPLPGADLSIHGDTGDFAYVDPAGKGSLVWDGGSGTLTISGIVRVDGVVDLGDSSTAALTYEGTGVLWSTQDIRVHSDLYPAGNYLSDGPDADAQIDGNLGLVSSGDMILDPAGGAAPPPLDVLASLFAAGTLDVRDAANIAGAVITNKIDIAAYNRLNIWYTPKLSAISPFGMPATQHGVTIDVSVVDWRQVR